MAEAWIEKKAWEIGLEGYELISALAYAGNEGWLDPREGWKSLTSAGVATISSAGRGDDKSDPAHRYAGKT
jgi:hypothetical protein